MNPIEKLKRMESPTCAEDYSIVLSESELRTFTEGRSLLASLKRGQREARLQEDSVDLKKPYEQIVVSRFYPSTILHYYGVNGTDADEKSHHAKPDVG